MPELVVAALEEDAVDAEDRRGALHRERRRAGDGVFLGDAHVHELPAGALAPLLVEAHDVGGSGGEHADARIALDGVHQVRAGDLRVALGGAVGTDGEARFEVEGAHMMPGFGVRLGRREARALGRVHVEHDGVRDVAQVPEGGDERFDIVALLDIAVFESERAERVVLRRPVRGAELGEAAIEPTVVLRDGLVVVVAHDQHAGIKLAGGVEALERETARQGSVAYDGDDAVVFAREVASHGDAAGEADRGGRVAHGEQVERRLARVGEAGGLVCAGGVGEGGGAAREHLVRIGLVGDVEEDAVARRVEDVVQRDGELDRGQVRCDMTALARAECEDRAAQFGAERDEPGGIEGLNVCG